MARIFFTSDLHLGHANILRYEAEKRRNAHGQPFYSIAEMDDYLVDQWNQVVSEDDVVYCLGDMCMKLQYVTDVLPFLNGKKILIAGNHDAPFKSLISNDSRARQSGVESALQAGFSEVYLQLDIQLESIGQVKLSHFPYTPPNQAKLPDYELRYLDQRPKRGKEKLLLHGHVHSQWLRHTYSGYPPMINVGVDMWNLRPVSEQKIVELFKSA